MTKAEYKARYKYWTGYYNLKYPTLIEAGLNIHLAVEAKISRALKIEERLSKLEKKSFKT